MLLIREPWWVSPSRRGYAIPSALAAQEHTHLPPVLVRVGAYAHENTQNPTAAAWCSSAHKRLRSPILLCPGTHCTGRRALFSNPAEYNHRHKHTHTYIYTYTHTYTHTHTHTYHNRLRRSTRPTLYSQSSVRERQGIRTAVTRRTSART